MPSTISPASPAARARNYESWQSHRVFVLSSLASSRSERGNAARLSGVLPEFRVTDPIYTKRSPGLNIFRPARAY
jgi:hypothetical protein